MKFNRITDLLLNVLLPLLLGYIVYYAGQQGGINPGLKNYLPDGLWAYAFISALLIIWNRRLPFGWIISIYVLAAGFELLQYYKVVAGQADSWDVAVYFLFISAGLLLNSLFKRLYFHKTTDT
jgi:hypothetical protein